MRPLPHVGGLIFFILSQAGGLPVAAQQAAPPGAAAAPLVAQTVPSSEHPIRFRRIFVPDDAKEEILLRECRDCGTIKASDFEALVRAAVAAADGTPDPRAAVLSRAEYSASYVDGALVAGQATLELVPGAQDGAVLPLSPFRLAIGEATWDDGQGEILPARLGLSADGRVAVLVKPDSRLNFSWSLQGAATEMGDHRFELHVPQALTSQLLLRLPPDKRPVVDVGIVSRAAPSDAPPSDAPGGAEEGAEEEEHLAENPLWRIQLGSHTRATLRITSTDEVERGRPLVLLSREQLRYDLSPRGMQLTADLTLDVFYERLNEVTLKLTSPLQLTSARYDDEELEWNAEFTDDAAARLITIRLPEPVLGVGSRLRLTCLAPIVWDQRWRLPTMQVVQARWQQGQATVELSDGVHLKYFNVQHGRETGVEPLPNKGQLRRVQLYSERPWLEVVVASRAPEPELTAATRLHFNGTSLNATTTVELNSLWGDVYEATAYVPKAWLIDSVESLTDDVGFRSDVSPASATQQRLRLQLQRPVTPKQPVRFRIRAHREAPPINRPISAAQFRLVDFRELPMRRHVWAITTEAGYQFRLKDDVYVEPLRAAAATDAERSTLPIDSADLLLLDDDSLQNASFVTMRESPAFTGEIAVTATVGDELLTQAYRILCYPRSTLVRRVLVHLTEAHETPIIWTLAGQDGTPLLATRQGSQGGAAGGETWEITLPTPQARPFSIIGEATVPWEQPRFLSLASLPEAISQVGRLSVRCDGDRSVVIDAPDLVPIPTDTFEPGQFRRVVGKYRYEPSQATRARLAPRGELAADQSLPLWVWRHELTTRVAADGAERHVARLLIENQGRTALTVTLPNGTDFEQMWIDGAAATPIRLADTPLRLHVALPAGVRYPAVQVRYKSRRAALRDRSQLAPLVLKVDAPVLAADWKLWLPPAFALVAEDAQLAPTERWQRGLRELLFGAESALSAVPSRRSHSGSPDNLSSFDVSGGAADDAQRDDPGDDAPEAAPSGSPWSDLSGSTEEASDAGWRTATLPLPASDRDVAVAANLVHQPTRRAYGWAALLMTAALAWRLARWRLGLAVLLGIVAWAGLMIGPASWLAIFAGTMLGGVLGFFLFLATPLPKPRLRSRGETSTAAAVAPYGIPMLLAMAVAMSWWSRGLADENLTRHSASPPAPVYRVYVPVDENGQPLNDYVHLPPSFHKLLKARQPDIGEASRGFQLTSASYEAEIQPGSAEESSLTIAAFTATFQVTTLAAELTVTLPLSRSQTAIASMQLDGVTVPVMWDSASASGSSVSVSIAEAGDHEIKVFMQPRLQTWIDAEGIDLQIPAAPNSQLLLSHPRLSSRAVRELRFPTAIGQVTRRSELVDGTPVALGPTDRLVIEWPTVTAETMPMNEGLSADQYLWLHVRPSSLLIDALLTFRTNDEPIRMVQLRADPRLSLLPLPTQSNVVDQRVLDGEPRTIRLLLDREYEREVSLRLQFLWEPAGETEINALTFPGLEAVARQINRNWVAVTLPPGIVAMDTDPEGSELLAPDSFAASFGETATAPTLAYSLAAGDLLWSLPLQRQETPIRADQQMEVSIGARNMEITYRARLPAAANRFQYRLRVPAGFQPQSAVVRSDIVQRVRPAMDGDGQLTIFLNELPRGETMIQLIGTIPTPLGQSLAAPVIHLLGAESTARQISIYRKSDVAVQFEDANVAASAVTAPPWNPKLGRLLADWQGLKAEEVAAMPPTLRVIANQPRLRARTVTELVPRDDAWQAALELLVDVRGGFVDQLRLEVPAQWTNIRAQDAADTELEFRSAAGQTRSHLLIRPSEPLRGEYRLRLLGDIPTTSVDIVLVPEITLAGVAAVDRLVVLPTDLQRRQIAWEISGLREMDLPDDYIFANPRLQAYSSFQVVGPAFQAKIVRVERTLNAPQVRLADIFVRWDESSRLYGSATFDLEPAGLSECRLAVPRGCRLLNVLIGDVAVPLRWTSDTECVMQLGSRDLPQRIEIVFQGSSQWQGKLDRQTTLVAPMLVDLPVERTLWTVVGDPTDAAGPPQVEGRVSSLRQEMYRLEAIHGLVDLAADVAVEGGVGELENWYRRWTRRYVRSVNRLEQHLTHEPESVVVDVTNFREALEERRTGLVERLRTVSIERAVRENRPRLVDLSDVTLVASGVALDAHTSGSAGGPSSSTIHCMFIGARPQLSLSVTSLRASQFWKRLSLALVIGGLFITLAMLRAHLPLGEWGARWPYASGVLVGLAWWLWLPPNYLGWIIVAISMLGAVRLPAASHPWTRVSDHASTVVRNGD